jgi:hypothetical protein
MGKIKKHWPGFVELHRCTHTRSKWSVFAALILFLLATGARAQDQQPEEPASNDPATDSRNPDSASDNPDPASNPPSVKIQKEPALRTSVSGRWQSEMIMSQRYRIRYLDDGTSEKVEINVFPFYNTISLRADELGHKGLSLHFQGWFAVDLADVYFQERIVADPTYLYLQFRDYGFDIKAGRQFVYQGAARALHIDGVSFSYQSRINLGVQAIGGLIVTPKHGPNWYEGEQATSYQDFGSGFSDWKRLGLFGDWAAGGRLFYRQAGVVTAGVSILHRSLHDTMAFEELGADLHVVPFKWLTITGDALLSLAPVGMKEANVALDFFPLDSLTISVDYRHADPTLYIPNSSIFSVFSDEKYDAVGGEIFYRIITHLSLSAGYHQLFYRYLKNTSDQDAEDQTYTDARDTGYRMNAGITGKWGTRGGMALLDYRRIKQDRNGMNQFRGGVIVPLPGADLRATSNLYFDLYDRPVNSKEFSFLGEVGLMWRYKGWETGGAFTAGTTPYDQEEFKGMVKVTYKWDVRFYERRQ